MSRVKVLVAVEQPHGARLASALSTVGGCSVSTVPPGQVAQDAVVGSRALLSSVDVLVLGVRRDTLTRDVVRACDRAAVKIIAIAPSTDAEHLARSYGLEPLPLGAVSPADVLAAIRGSHPPRAQSDLGRIIAVWGPQGAPGRTTLAVEIAAAQRRSGSRVALIDADSDAPAVASVLGVPVDAPGLATACAHEQRAALGPTELERLSAKSNGLLVIPGVKDRCAGIGGDAVAGVCRSARTWVDDVVVDTGALARMPARALTEPTRESIETEGALGALRSADVLIAVLSADPVGVARFVESFPGIHRTVGETPVCVVANRLRPGALGVDARGQVRRALGNALGITDVVFTPNDPRSVDAALLARQPAGLAAPRSPLVSTVRRLVGDLPPIRHSALSGT